MQASTPLHKSHLVIYFTESLRDSSINQKGFATRSKIHILGFFNLKTSFVNDFFICETILKR